MGQNENHVATFSINYCTKFIHNSLMEHANGETFYGNNPDLSSLDLNDSIWCPWASLSLRTLFRNTWCIL